MINLSDLFWEAGLEDIKRGYIFDKGSFICLFCGETFRQGRIYDLAGQLFDAQTAAARHIETEHSSVFESLLELDKKYTGFTEHQKNLLRYFYHGYSDKDIVAELGGSTSTIRNYRFSFKEKEKQAKVFLAIMELLRTNPGNQEKLINIHRGAKMVDERYAITEDEYNKVLAQYFKEGLDGPLELFPKKEKRKIIILKHLVSKFELNRKYTEKEVNEKLKHAYFDYVTLRRYLIEYGFMDRYNDGSFYWVKP